MFQFEGLAAATREGADVLVWASCSRRPREELMFQFKGLAATDPGGADVPV